jgi:hypothetical protein
MNSTISSYGFIVSNYRIDQGTWHVSGLNPRISFCVGCAPPSELLLNNTLRGASQFLQTTMTGLVAASLRPGSETGRNVRDFTRFTFESRKGCSAASNSSNTAALVTRSSSNRRSFHYLLVQFIIATI